MYTVPCSWLILGKSFFIIFLNLSSMARGVLDSGVVVVVSTYSSLVRSFIGKGLGLLVFDIAVASKSSDAIRVSPSPSLSDKCPGIRRGLALGRVRVGV